MSQSHTVTQEVRAEEVKVKIQPDEKVLDKLQAGCGVIIYDDAVKSGTTLDTAAQPLLDRGIQVIAIVNTCWKDGERVDIA